MKKNHKINPIDWILSLTIWQIFAYIKLIERIQEMDKSKSEITIITREGTLECVDDWLWSLWDKDKDEHVPLQTILDPHSGKYVKLELTVYEWKQS